MVKDSETNQTDSRQRILDAARDEFSEKGFDGARVDEIAKRADVNKALIYYYFKSKDELLQELLRQFLDDRARRKASLEHDKSKLDFPDRVAEFDIEFLFEQRDILRIAMMEDLKASKDGLTKGGTVLKQWLEGLVEARDAYAEKGYGFRYTPRVIVALYFYHLIPTLSFATLGETLANVVGIDHQVVREEFLKLVHETIGTHFHSVFGSSGRDSAPEVPLPGLTPAPPSKTMQRIFESFQEGSVLSRSEAETLLGRSTDEPSRYFEMLLEYHHFDPRPNGKFVWNPAPRPTAAAKPKPQAHLESTESERRKLVSKHMPNGRLEKFPLKEKARLAVIEHISGLFEAGKIYTEKQVDTILKTVADDHTKVRRYLVDYKHLDRKPDGSKYWTWEGPKP